MLRIGIIGVGHMGRYHANICKSLSSVKLTAVADVNEKNLSVYNQAKIITSTDYTTWLDEVDAVIIAVPTDYHFDIAKHCLENRKHILLEKPITRTEEQARELFALAEKQDLTLHVGHVERFNGAVTQLKKMIHDPYLIESERMGPFTSRPANDSVIIDLMIHDIDLILSLIDSPVKTSSIMGSNIKTEKCDIASLHLQFENKVLAKVVSSRASHKRKRTMRIHQKDCYIDLDFANQEITIHSLDSTTPRMGRKSVSFDSNETVQHLKIKKGNALELEIKHFISSIETKQHMRDPNHDIAALRLALGVEKQLSS